MLNLTKKLLSVFDWLYWVDWVRMFFVVVVFTILTCGVMCIKQIKDAPPRREQIKTLAVGELINIRATGDFSVYNTELKFKDGSMLVVTYSFSRRYNLRVGQRYKIWKSSRYGYQCKNLLVKQ